MKICIITIHFGVNHGSALQTYALYKFLNLLGHEVSVIDYIPDRYNAWKNIMNKKHLFIIKLAYFIFTFPIRTYRRKIFKRFLRKNVKLTKRYKNQHELIQNPPDADVYIAGSDQVWNRDYNGSGEYSYYLPFVRKNKKKISYSSSFGRDVISKEEINDIKEYLKQFKKISVREDSGLKILEKCGINYGVHVLDPTLLLTREQWERLASKKTIRNKYLLIYVMDHKFEKLLEYGSKIAGHFGLKIFVICFRKIRDKRMDSCFYNIGSKEFLNLFCNATYVVTNSYHGVLFSIIFEKQFIAIPKEKYNTRIESILNLMKIRDRFIYNNFSIENVTKKINYEKVNIELNKVRERSKNFLMESLKTY